MIGYCRVSTEEQGQSGLGLEAQEAALRLRYPDIEIRREVASGAKKDRPVLTTTLEQLGRGELDGLAVAKLDRVARDTIQVLDIAEAATKQGWNFVALDLGIDTTTPNGKLVLTIFAALGEWERNTIRERIRLALAAKKARGERLGRLPGRNPVVTQAVQGLAHLNLQEISRLLAEDGILTRTGRPLSRSSIKRYLQGTNKNTECTTSSLVDIMPSSA